MVTALVWYNNNMYNKTTNPVLNGCMYTIKLTQDFGGYSDVKQLHITPLFHHHQYYFYVGWREIQVHVYSMHQRTSKSVHIHTAWRCGDDVQCTCMSPVVLHNHQAF